MSDWVLTFDDYDPGDELRRETLCTLGNGYFATRGAQPEAVADRTRYPGTYAAGVYNRLSSDVAGRHVENESLVNLPNWLCLRCRIDDGAWMGSAPAEILSQEVELNLERGVLIRKARLGDDRGRVIRVTQRRFVSMRDAHHAGLETTFVAENWSGTLQVESAIDGTVQNGGVDRYQSLKGQHLVVVDSGFDGADTVWVEAMTSQSHIRIAEAARTRLFQGGSPLEAEPERVDRDGYVGLRLTVEVEQGDEVTAEKVVALYLSRDAAISEPCEEARRHLGEGTGFEELLQRHLMSWRHLWGRARFELGTDGRIAQAIHLNVFHLLQTVSNNTTGLDVGVPARGLHGEAYRGHVFWDELFILPFLSVRFPQIARALLLYRFRRLDAARIAAAEAGHRGAMFPWQSASSGREETQTAHLNPVSGRWLRDASSLQHHINAAIVFNVWHYYQSTGDTEFLRYYGAELILEIARFWGSLAIYSHASDRYEIFAVMGPDEYHDGYPDRDDPGVDNNAYTNVMAVWCLRRAFHTLEILPAPIVIELKERLGLTPRELAHWDDVSRKMRICFHEGVISQFERYEQLEELDWDAYRGRYGDIARLDRILEAEGDTTNRYKLSKQADVTMLFYLLSDTEVRELLERLGYDADEGLIDRCIAYYEARTSNGSTLSRIVEAWVHARRDPDRAWESFVNAVVSDLHGAGGTTGEGIHLGAMGGAIDLLQRGFTGLEVRSDELRLDPSIPRELESISCSIRYREHVLHLSASDDLVEVRADPDEGTPVNLVAHDQAVVVEPGHAVRIELDDATKPDRSGRRRRRHPRPRLGSRRRA
jgi:trehalose 6-phosphate phosphatase